MKSPAEYIAAAHTNSMSVSWCAARVADIRAHVNEPYAEASRECYRTWLIELLSQLDSTASGAEAAVTAALADAERYKTNLVGAVIRSHSSIPTPCSEPSIPPMAQ
jgi:hypothetical protein